MAGNINPHGVGRVAFVESGQLIKWKESIKNRRPVWSRIDVTYRTFVPWLIKSSRSRQQRSWFGRRLVELRSNVITI